MARRAGGLPVAAPQSNLSLEEILMHLSRPFTLFFCLPFACTAASDTTATADTSSSTSPGGSSSGSGSAASTSDDPTEHDTHTSHHASGTTGATTGGETTSSHETTGHATHDPETTGTTATPGSTSSTGGGDPPPIADYCACMLENCHDQYHGTWGEDHEAAEAMCTAAAEALPSVGMPATDGNSIECRYHHCQLGHDDPGACESAIGGGTCV